MFENAAQKRDTVNGVLLERLLVGQYRFGERLLVKELCEELGVSRHPMMSALASLRTMGFVSIIPQVGCEVVAPSRQEIEDFYLLFSMMEGLIAKLAAARRSAEDLAEMIALNKQVSEIDKSLRAAGQNYRRLNFQFHSRIHAAAKSPMLHDRQKGNFSLCDFYIVQTCGFSLRIDTVNSEHLAIIGAIERGSGDCARVEAERHLMAVCENVLSHL